MATPATTIWVFTNCDDLTSQRRASVLSAGLTRAGVACRVIDRQSTRLGDLMIVAEYRVLAAPLWMITHDDVPVLRLYGVPSTRDALALLQQVQSCPSTRKVSQKDS